MGLRAAFECADELVELRGELGADSARQTKSSAGQSRKPADGTGATLWS